MHNVKYLENNEILPKAKRRKEIKIKVEINDLESRKHYKRSIKLEAGSSKE